MKFLDVKWFIDTLGVVDRKTQSDNNSKCTKKNNNRKHEKDPVSEAWCKDSSGQERAVESDRRESKLSGLHHKDWVL